MKKLIIIIITVIITATYIFIPNKLSVTNSILARCSQPCANRVINNYNNWPTWWKEETKTASKQEHTINNVNFTYVSGNFSDAMVNLQTGGLKIPSSILTGMNTHDSAFISWTYTINTGNTPWQKLAAYFASKKLNGGIKTALSNLQQTLNTPALIYGTDITTTKLTDSTLVAIKAQSPAYPSTEQIYALVEKLETYAKANGAAATNYPMLNIDNANSNMYNYMVALPVNKQLPNSGNIEMKKLLANGNFLMSGECIGGISKIKKFATAIEEFKNDYSFISPAIPFQSLITNRKTEPDSNKWVTKMYYPIF
jgi:hypothetical protein